MASNNKLIKKYIKVAKKNCPKALRKRLDNELKNNLIEFCNSEDFTTAEIIENKFGKPEQYAAEYLSLCDTDDLKKKLNNSKTIKTAIIATALVILLTFFAAIVYIVKRSDESRPKYIYVTVTEEDEDDKNN